MNTPISIEPARFGMTGNRMLSDLQFEFVGDEGVGPLDAPGYIARGSVQCHLLKADEFGPAKYYISHTEWRRQW
jgi:hypothetical protein